MSITKILISVAIIIAIVALGWIYFNNMGTTPVATPPVQPVATQPVAPAAVQNTATPLTDTSDTALDADLADIDAQLKNLADDGTKIDTGMNDKPVAQTI